MTEHDDKENKPVSERERDWETRGEKSFLLFVAVLLALTLFILLIVSGSLSKITSSGTVDGFSLQVAGFNVEVTEGEYSYEDTDEYADFQRSLYSFTITNNSNVDVDVDVGLSDMVVSFENGSSKDIGILEGLTILLIEDGNEEDEGVLLYTVTSGTDVNTDIEVDAYNYTFSLSTSDEGNESKSYVLVADYSGCTAGETNDTVSVAISGTLTVTATQAEGVIE